MFRTTLGMLIGIALAAATVYGAQYGFTYLYPPPPGTAPATPETLIAFMMGAHPENLQKYLSAAPREAIACVLGGWALAALIGGWVGAAIARPHRGATATLVGALLTIAVLAYAVLMPSAAWITVVGLLLPMPFAVLAGRLAMPRREF